MNHHLHESAKKESRKLATFCFIKFFKENVYLFIYLRIFKLKPNNDYCLNAND